jgi:hypothetical protein
MSEYIRLMVEKAIVSFGQLDITWTNFKLQISEFVCNFKSYEQVC